MGGRKMDIFVIEPGFFSTSRLKLSSQKKKGGGGGGEGLSFPRPATGLYSIT